MSLYQNRQGLDCLIRAQQNLIDETSTQAARFPLRPFPILEDAESDLEHLQRLLRKLPRPSIVLRALRPFLPTARQNLDLNTLIAAQADFMVRARLQAARFPLRPLPALQAAEADLEDLLEQARKFQAESPRPRSRKFFSRFSRMCSFPTSPTHPLLP